MNSLQSLNARVNARFWKKAGAGDKHSIVFNILKADETSRVLYPADFEPLLYGVSSTLLITDLVENHQGVVFLRGEEMNEFRRRFGILLSSYPPSRDCHYTIILYKTKQLYRTHVSSRISTFAFSLTHH
jgi:hypothetical protein